MKRLYFWILMLPHVLAFGQAPEPQYGIKDVPRTGSNINRYAVQPLSIPVNLPYHQLPPEARKTLHGYYQEIKEGDEPPFPAEGLKAYLDPIQKAQQKLLVEGAVNLIATVDRKGEVVRVQVLGTPIPKMSEFAGRALLLTRFKPAVCAGEPCQMDFPVYLLFMIKW
jgi:hypothetical protein